MDTRNIQKLPLPMSNWLAGLVSKNSSNRDIFSQIPHCSQVADHRGLGPLHFWVNHHCWCKFRLSLTSWTKEPLQLSKKMVSQHKSLPGPSCPVSFPQWHKETCSCRALLQDTLLLSFWLREANKETRIIKTKPKRSFQVVKFSFTSTILIRNYVRLLRYRKVTP